MNRILIPMLLVSLALAACDKAGEATAPTTAGAKLKEDLRQVGQDIKAAGDEAATRMKPAMDRAAENAREAVHNAATRVAQDTAPTRPSTVPATLPQ